MRVGISATLHDGGISGIGRYVSALLEGIAVSPAGLDYVVFTPSGDRGPLPDAPHMRYLPLPGWTRAPVPDVLWHQVAMGREARRLRLDCVHFLACRRVSWRVPCASVVTVHDLAPLHVARKYDRARMLYQRRVIPALLRRQDRVVSVSESTRRDLLRVGVAAEKIRVVPQGVDHGRYFPRSKVDAAAHLRELFDLSSPFLLYVARLEHPGKNHVRLLRAFRAVMERHPSLQLVLAGAPWSGAAEIYRESDALELGGRVRFIGFVTEEELPFLYCAAEALVFPSLFEGFGLPLLEAMACGTPVVASNVASIPEVVGDCAILVDPESESDIARGIEAVLVHDVGRQLAARGLERARSFTWTRTVAEVQVIYREAAATYRD